MFRTSGPMTMPGKILYLTICLCGLQTVQSFPVFNSFDKVVVLSETVNTNTVLSTIDCTDDGGAPVSVDIQSMAPTSPCFSCFDILTCGTNECLEYRAGQGTLLAASASSYVITVSCRNAVDPVITENVFVIIQANQSPYFNPDSLYETGGNTGSATAIVAGTSIYQIDAQDDDTADTVQFFMSTLPAEFDSFFEIGATDGIIRTTVSMAFVCAKEITFEVSIYDGRVFVGPKIVSYTLNTPNLPPAVPNLDAEIHIPEDFTGSFYTIRVFDGNPFTQTYTYTSTNSAGLAQFNFNGNRKIISPVGTLDYEDASLRETDVQMQFTDSFCTSDFYTFRIVVTDVNEAPVISPVTSTIQVCESIKSFDPGLTVTDEDVGDTKRWTFHSTMANGNAFYGIEATTGILTVIPDYDVDAGIHNTNKDYVIQVEDKGGLTATATVAVEFLDCNDNAPIFDQPSYVFTTTACTAAGTNLGTVAATDADSARENNNVITYSGSAGAAEVNAAGEVILTSALVAGTVLNFDAVATDGGTDPKTQTSVTPAKISIIFTECPTTVPPVTTAAATTAAPTTAAPITTIAPNTASLNGQLPWIVAAAIFGAIFLGLLAFTCWKFGALLRCPTCNRPSCKKPCQKKPRPRKVQHRGPLQKPPSSPPPVEDPARPGFIFGFWKERFPDNDFNKQPDRLAVPEPGNLDPVYPHTIDNVDEPDTTVAGTGPDKPKRKSCTIL